MHAFLDVTMSNRDDIQRDDPSIIQCTTSETRPNKRNSPNHPPVKINYLCDKKLSAQRNVNFRSNFFRDFKMSFIFFYLAVIFKMLVVKSHIVLVYIVASHIFGRIIL